MTYARVRGAHDARGCMRWRMTCAPAPGTLMRKAGTLADLDIVPSVPCNAFGARSGRYAAPASFARLLWRPERLQSVSMPVVLPVPIKNASASIRMSGVMARAAPRYSAR